MEGAYPSGHSGPRADPITVGMEQPPARIFSEIRRRLLPEYLATIDAALKAAAEAAQHEQARIAMNRRLEQVLPSLGHSAMPHRGSAGRSKSYWSGGEEGIETQPALAAGEVKLSHDATSMDLQITGVPAELGLRILGLLNPSTAPELEGVPVPQEAAPPQPVTPVPRTVLVQGQVFAYPAAPAARP